MKGIILAGGSGSRLFPITKGVSKQLLPVYDKPMIYYPLSVLLLAGIKEILIISSTEDLFSYKRLLGDGSKLGIKLFYKEQLNPNGLAEAFIIGEDFIQEDSVCLVLGDNIFYGDGFSNQLEKIVSDINNDKNAYVFGYSVSDPQRYGVISFDKSGKINSIDEKPKFPKSNYAVIGLYFYPNSVINLAKQVKPSKRGELEITSVNEKFLKLNKLKVELLGRGFAWLDTGTPESLIEAGQLIKAIEKRQGLKVGCIEEIAFNKGYISKSQLLDLSKEYNNSYGEYLLNLTSS
tara:strand:- start:2275 stop:3147 length:873 start_codon:yes stop_codon:yes gene_type:complete